MTAQDTSKQFGRTTSNLTGRTKSAIAALLLAQTILLAWSATRQSPTIDEPAHLVAGLSHWQLGRFDLYCVNPPLVRMAAALPVLATNAKTDWSHLSVDETQRPEFHMGTEFVAANGMRSFWFFSLARWACIPFALIGGWFCFRWANELFGNAAGLIALVLWTFSPSVLAHGQLITTDVPAAAFGIAACYAFWRWLKSPSWSCVFGAGIWLGLTELTKMTWLILFAVWPAIWLAWTFRLSSTSSRLREAMQLAAILLLGLNVLNLGYAFEGSFARLGSYAFTSRTLLGIDDVEGHPLKGLRGNRFAETWLAELPVPLPRDYVLGLDLQKREFEDPPGPSYIDGQLSDRGWWYFYLYALALKTPLGILVLVLMVIGWRALARDRPLLWRDELALLAAPLALLIVVSAQSGFSQHSRYVLPVVPFGMVWVAQSSRLAAETRIRATVVAAMIIWSTASSLSVYPHELSYFNELAGGPIEGHRRLINSDYDWGQDLHFLRSWYDTHLDARPLSLAYYGNFDPRDAGIEFVLPPVPPELANGELGKVPLKPGWYAVSVNFLHGLPRRVPDEDQSPDGTLIPRGAYRFLLDTTPAARAGYSICIFQVEAEER